MHSIIFVLMIISSSPMVSMSMPTTYSTMAQCEIAKTNLLENLKDKGRLFLPDARVECVPLDKFDMILFPATH
jgi:hypothetical protein